MNKYELIAIIGTAIFTFGLVSFIKLYARIGLPNNKSEDDNE